MRMNFQTALPVEAEKVIERRRVRFQEPKPIQARPVENPDYDALRKKIMSQFSKTLAYLAK